MKAIGITAEFDPLHNGHAYLMDEARRLTGCGAVVVAMSGDFVQRGGPAVSDKWTRTRAALSCGADLVIEIPAMFCLGDASRYAGASVKLLEAAGCTRIVFGSESGDTALIERTAGHIRSMAEELSAGISALSGKGLSYPAAREAAYSELRKASASPEELEAELSVLREPNDILALEYILRMEKALPLAVKRKGSPHSGDAWTKGAYRSASYIRDILRERQASGEPLFEYLDAYMPDGSVAALEEAPLSFADDWTEVLRYAVMSSDPAVIEDCPSGGEGLGHLLKKAAFSGDGFNEIISSVKSKRYTYTRISRLCMQLVLGISRSAYPYRSPEYIRVLGFNDRGRGLLSHIKSSGGAGLPIVTNINKEVHALGEDARRMIGLDMHASDLYNLVSGRDTVSESDRSRMPIIEASSD